jgi:hypothetical protein
MVLSMVPGNLSWLVPTKLDVKGALVQMLMKGPPVFMKIDLILSKFIVKMYPEYEEYLGADGSLATELLKVMYGCVQTSKLWFDLIVSILKGLGYQQSPTEPCVMRRLSDGKTFIVMIYVNDLMVLATKAKAERIRNWLIVKFGEVMMDSGTTLSYLGMQLMNDAVHISMDYFVEQLVNGLGLSLQSSPGTRNTFKTSIEVKLLKEEHRKIFHSTVAKLLYLSK